MPVGLMLRSMTSHELREWRVIWSEYETFGDERADLRNGITCSLIDGVNRTKGKPKPPKDYMPFTGKRNYVTDPQDIANVFKLLM